MIENLDIFIMTIAFGSCWVGYFLAEANPLGFDQDEGHCLMATIASVGCAMLAIGFFVLGL